MVAHRWLARPMHRTPTNRASWLLKNGGCLAATSELECGSGRRRLTNENGAGWLCDWQRRRRLPEAGASRPSATARRTAKLARLEAVLLVADMALPPRKLASLALLADATEARTLIARLNTVYEAGQAPFRVERVASGYRLLTLPQFALWLGKLHHRDADLKLSPPALETLTVIAYRQPLTRADVEAIRGVQCSEMIRQLMDRGLVRLGGHDDSLGRPFLYETTRLFLEIFGLKDLDDLPLAHRLRKPAAADSAKPIAQSVEGQNSAALPLSLPRVG